MSFHARGLERQLSNLLGHITRLEDEKASLQAENSKFKGILRQLSTHHDAETLVYENERLK